MFKEFINDAKITFTLKPNTPLRIHSGTVILPNAALPDSQLIRSKVNGVNTPIIPGSSLKGVFRSHTEKIVRTIDPNFKCDIFTDDKNKVQCKQNSVDKNDNDKDTDKDKDKYKDTDKGIKTYNEVCSVCKMYGNTLIGGRVLFKDSYPSGKFNIGIRNGVKIDRITGSASGGGLYSFEVIEDAEFHIEIMLKNYVPYQLILLLNTMRDLDDGYVTLGAGSTRGFGAVSISNVAIKFRDYRKKTISDFGNQLKFIEKDYFSEASIDGLETIFELISKYSLKELLSNTKIDIDTIKN